VKRQRGFQTDHLRRLFRGGPRKPIAEGGPAPHIAVPARSPTAPHHNREDHGDRLRATLERWARLNAPIPEALIRRGLAALRLDREALGEAVRFDEVGRRATRIHESAHFAVDVLCWRPGQLGPIQEHDGSAFGFLVVEGMATEIIFQDSPCGRLAPSRSHRVPAGAVSVARGGEIRSIANLQAPGHDLIGLRVASPSAGTGRLRSLSETIFSAPDAGG
jgi:cysteine dioxygenase